MVNKSVGHSLATTIMNKSNNLRDDSDNEDVISENVDGLEAPIADGSLANQLDVDGLEAPIADGSLANQLNGIDLVNVDFIAVDDSALWDAQPENPRDNWISGTCWRAVNENLHRLSEQIPAEAILHEHGRPQMPNHVEEEESSSVADVEDGYSAWTSIFGESS